MVRAAALVNRLLLSTRANEALTASSSIDWHAYEQGQLGLYPQVKFKSTPVTAPIIHRNDFDLSCASSGKVFMSPKGQNVRGNQALILDERGDLVYHHQEVGSIYNLHVQYYRGDPYLTYFVGDDDYVGHAHGYYKMTYTLAFTLNAHGDIDGDFHEFQITANETAIITSYVRTPWDLTAFGREDGFIWDCVFQEISIEDDALLFEWRASQHFSFGDMQGNSWQDWTGTSIDPWDWFHLNSVYKDSQGNYLISARYAGSVSSIDGTTGQVQWSLGGLHNQFNDFGVGNATQFVNPHMARWTSTNSLTVFDSDVAWNPKDTSERPNAREIKLDFERNFAEVVAEFSHPAPSLADSEGSLQALPNGNYFAGFGSTSVYAEFARNGTLLCDAHYAPTNVSDNDRAASGVKSYRIYKMPWVGHPSEPPDVEYFGSKLHVSWNGATELGWWKLEGRHSLGRRATAWRHIATIPRQGFETTFSLNEGAFTNYQLTALGRDQGFLRSWNMDSDGEIRELDRDFPGQNDSNSGSIAMIIICFLLLFWLNRRSLRKSSPTLD